MVKAIVIAGLLGYLVIMVWGIIISGKRRPSNWFKLLAWNPPGLLDFYWRRRPK